MVGGLSLGVRGLFLWLKDQVLYPISNPLPSPLSLILNQGLICKFCDLAESMELCHGSIQIESSICLFKKLMTNNESLNNIVP